MKKNEVPEFAALLGNVMKYYRQDLTPFLLNVWSNGCAPYQLADVRAALERHMADPERGQFPPRLSDVTRALLGTRSDRAVVAWGVVYEAMGRVGAYQDVVFDDALVHAVVNDMGGWPRLCRVEERDLSITQHRFMEMYRAFCERGVDSWPRMLQGDRAADSEFERKGLKPPAPILVGNASQCSEVFTGGGVERAKLTQLPAGTDVAALASALLPWDVKRLGGPGRG